MANDLLGDRRLGSNKQHRQLPLLRQSIDSRLAGYEDVNDAERLSVDPAMRHVVGGRAVLAEKHAASTSDAAGFFYLGVSPGLVSPGRICRISIRTIGVDSERWVGLIPITDPVERQAANVSD